MKNQEPYNQGIKVQNVNKSIKKEEALFMIFPVPNALCAKGIFQIEPLFMVLTFQKLYQNPV